MVWRTCRRQLAIGRRGSSSAVMARAARVVAATRSRLVRSCRTNTASVGLPERMGVFQAAALDRAQRLLASSFADSLFPPRVVQVDLRCLSKVMPSRSNSAACRPDSRSMAVVLETENTTTDETSMLRGPWLSSRSRLEPRWYGNGGDVEERLGGRHHAVLSQHKCPEVADG